MIPIIVLFTLIFRIIPEWEFQAASALTIPKKGRTENDLV